jgi:hypothetical protein
MPNALNVWDGAALLLLALSLVVRPALAAEMDAPADEKRIPWTTGRVTGSPEPPPPYAA